MIYSQEMREKCRQAAILQHKNMSCSEKKAIAQKISTAVRKKAQEPGCTMGHHKPHTKESIELISKGKKGMLPWNKGKKLPSLTLEHKRKLNAAATNHMKSIGLMPDVPCIGRQEKQILDFLEKEKGYKILRQYQIGGFFVDGYISELNLAIEIDEPHHFDECGNQCEGDIIRQQKIQKYSGCDFKRIKTKEEIL